MGDRSRHVISLPQLLQGATSFDQAFGHGATSRGESAKWYCVVLRSARRLSTRGETFPILPDDAFVEAMRPTGLPASIDGAHCQGQRHPRQPVELPGRKVACWPVPSVCELALRATPGGGNGYR
jgi:hypothetical protein